MRPEPKARSGKLPEDTGPKAQLRPRPLAGGGSSVGFAQGFCSRDAERDDLAAAYRRLGAGGYAVLAPSDAAPRLSKKSNILFFVADGFRADMMKPELTPNLLSFAARPEVIRSERHFSISAR